MYHTRKKAAQKSLNNRQAKTLKRHAKHHSKEHMQEMVQTMAKGKTFGEAHKKALAKVGK